ncbi:MAG: TAT-variant-translocated molybdopterin oxidoreductase [candidate division Zixibacteria bacterium]|nr:TAT-variant-translocated molybdopterin oxidoreductase [candidate division Zixibacteria bacterium]
MNDDLKPQSKDYWRSLDELADTPQFREFLHREFPKGTGEELADKNNWSRRNFLTLMGASLAMAGLASCRRPIEKIVPHVVLPEVYEPGTPIHYATSMPFGLDSYGLLVKSNDGRPTKIEGNPEHPSTIGRADIWIQAAILGLYDPDRAKNITHSGKEVAWDDFVADWSTQFTKFSANRGQGLAVMSEQFSSPTLARLKEEFMEAFPSAQFVSYEPVNDETIYDGIEAVAGARLQPLHSLHLAKVILSIDSDFVFSETGHIVDAMGFADGRRVHSQQDEMNRLYAVESAYTLTGSKADHRLALKPSQVGGFVLALARELSSQGLSIGRFDAPSANTADTGIDQKFVNVLAKDLLASKGQNVILAGRRQPAEVHSLVFALNEALGNVGQTVTYIAPLDRSESSTTGLEKLVADMKSGAVETLVVLGGNPVYTVPVEFGFADALKGVANKIQLSSHHDETSALVDWHLHQSHFLESWGDGRSLDGTVSVIQPLIDPLYASVSDVELLALVASGKIVKGYDAVRETWNSFITSDFENQWRKILHDGFVPKSAIGIITPKTNASSLAASARSLASVETGRELELVLLPSNLYDGRYANNGWLQELPEPINKFTWDNFAQFSFRTAQRLGVATGDLVKLEIAGRSINIPAWITPGQANDTIVIALGYGRKNVGSVANDVGSNAYLLTSAKNSGVASVTKIPGTHFIAQTQEHGTMGGFELGDPLQEKQKRPILRENTLSKFRENGLLFPLHPEIPTQQSIYTEPAYTSDLQWGMTIDLNACVGCGACVVACQSENNIPVVGKEQVSKGREMHWIRVDRYYSGDLDTPEIALQPVTCQHCENAPCEPVCPVGATVHDDQGLNVMIYNRCVGTRYCSNNCPYKVRRFNFFNYALEIPETVQMQKNPDVTVRSRGVMEKCTFCIQRIEVTRLKAKLETRNVGGDEVHTACQQACPTDAIVFGNIKDPNSNVARLKKSPRNYQLLEELNTKPRLTYLGLLRNPHPELEMSTES